MSLVNELFSSSNIFLVIRLLALLAFIKIIVFPLLENHSLDTRKRNNEPTVALSQIFLDYNHKDPEDWHNWIRKQDSRKRKLAFEKLVSYLDLSPELFKPVLNDVINIITSFKSHRVETAIYKLLQRISVPNPPQEFYEYYARALKAFIELNPQKAASFIEIEYGKYQNNPEYVKRFVLVSNFFPSDRLPVKLLCHYLLNINYILEERLKLLKSFKSKPKNLYQIAIAVLEKLLENKDLDPAITESCFISLLEIKEINQKDFLRSIKVLLNKTWVSDHLFDILKNYLIQDSEAKINPVSLASIISSTNPINYDSLKQVLYEKHNISEEEIKLIDSANEINKYSLNAQLKLEQAINIFDSNQETLPSFLEEKYEEFRSFCFNNKYNLFKLVYGNNESEKSLLIQKLANEEKKKLLIINIEQLANDQTLLDNLETHLKVILNKVLYIPNFDLLIKEISSDQKDDSVYTKILNRFRFMALKSNIPVIVSCNKELLDVKSNTMLTDEEEIPKQEYELCNFSPEERHTLINEYLNKLMPERKENRSR